MSFAYARRRDSDVKCWNDGLLANGDGLVGDDRDVGGKSCRRDGGKGMEEQW